jgi:hypothetical protein
MNRSKPSTLDGGGEMNRATSSIVNDSNSAGASPSRSSRSVVIDPERVGSPVRQPLRAAVATETLVTTASVSRPGGAGIFSIKRSFSRTCPRRLAQQWIGQARQQSETCAKSQSSRVLPSHEPAADLVEQKTTVLNRHTTIRVIPGKGRNSPKTNSNSRAVLFRDIRRSIEQGSRNLRN